MFLNCFYVFKHKGLCAKSYLGILNLSLKVKAVAFEEIKSLRNKSGGIYYSCGSCGSGRQTGICFYTEYGNRYHVMPNCSALKRMVRTVKISEVGNRHACSYCGGES